MGHIGIDMLVQKLGITIYFTSEDNSYGIIDQKWMNGEEMSIGTKFGTSKTIKIRPESRTMLVETSMCGQDHHYKCYGYKLISTMEKVRLKLFFLSKVFIYFQLLFLSVNCLDIFLRLNPKFD